MKRKEQATPWWLGAGTEICTCCGLAYAYHAEYRCEGCDTPLCACCVETVYLQPVLCAECKTAEHSVARK